MDNLVSDNNLQEILLGIRPKILQDIENRDITDEQKAILEKTAALIVNGDGNKILANNGEYKDCNTAELSEAVDKTNTVWDLFNIQIVPSSWKTGANTPQTQWRCRGTTDEKYLYVIGGYAGDFTNKCWRYDPTLNSWESIANCIYPHDWSALVFYDNKIYVIGGYGNSTTYCRKLQIYSIDTNTWSSGSDLPYGGYAMGAHIYNDNIYCFGGYDPSNYIQKYDIKTDAWSTMNSLSHSCYHNNYAGKDGNIYIMAGYIDNNTNKAFCYNLDTETETTLADTPLSSSLGSVCLYMNKIYCIGSTQVECINKIMIYDIKDDTWVVEDIPITNPHVSNGACGLIGNKMIIAGGCMKDVPSNYTYIYTIETNTYDIPLPDELENKLNTINTSGDGTKVLADNGQYVDIPKGYRYMTDDEITAMIAAVTAE